MSKQGQHNNDANDRDQSRGNNKHDKSMTITTGNVKKKETYAEQARNHEDPGKQAQAQKNEWKEDTRDPRDAAAMSAKQAPRARQSDLDSGRSGSDSNAGRGTRGH